MKAMETVTILKHQQKAAAVTVLKHQQKTAAAIILKDKQKIAAVTVIKDKWKAAADIVFTNKEKNTIVTTHNQKAASFIESSQVIELAILFTTLHHSRHNL